MSQSDFIEADKPFIEGGTIMGTYDSRTGFTPSAAYSEQVKSKTQKQLEDKSIKSTADLSHFSSAGFSRPRTIEEPRSERLQQQDRLALLQLERNRLADILKKKEEVISHVTKWLEDN